ncbi:MAG: hypothetical protein AAF297_11495 [Planctomycetota bacterium]
MNALDAVYAAVGALTAPVWARKARGSWSERFGRVPAERLARFEGSGRPRVLLHAVSAWIICTT